MTRGADSDLRRWGREGQVMSGLRSGRRRRLENAAAVRPVLARGTAGACWRERAGARPRIGRPRNSSPDTSGQADKLLINAANLAQDRQWSEAINIYQRVIDQFGDKVVMLPKDEAGADASGDFGLYVDERRFCHAAIAQLPPEARAIYRNRIDGLAERWFRAGSEPARSRSAPPRGRPGFLQLVGRRRARAAWETWRFRTADSVKRWRCTGGWCADRPGDSGRAGPSRSVGRPGAGRRQENALPRGRGREPARQGGSRRVRAALPRRRPGSLAGRKGAYAEILAESSGGGSSGPAVAARQPVADVRRVAHPVESRCRPDRCRLDPVACRARQGWDVIVSRPSGPAAAAVGTAASSPERLLAYHPDRAGRPGDRRRRHAGAGV